MPSTLVLPFPLPADEVKIGSFLVNPSDPYQNYIDPQEKDPGLKPSILRVDVTDFTNTIRDVGNKEVEGVLTGYFVTTFDWAKSKSLELSSAKAATYLMRNSDYWFEQACALAPMRRWFEWVTREGRKIYLLVGLRTIFDGHFKIEHTASTSMGGQVKVPTDTLAGLPPMGLDVGGGGKVSKDQTTSSEFSAAGERIWALQYRQIKFKWYSSKRMENAALETGTRWVTFNRSALSRVPRSSRVDLSGLFGSPQAGTGYSEPFRNPFKPVEERIIRKEEPLVEDADDMIEAFIDDEVDFEDQFDVENTNGETLFVPKKAEVWGRLWPPEMAGQTRRWSISTRNRISLPCELRTAVDDLEDVQPSNNASIIGRAVHLERLPDA